MKRAGMLTVLGMASLLAGFQLFAQDINAPINEESMFGGEGDIVKVIDTETAAAGPVELVKETKTYPVFLLEGNFEAGVVGSYTFFGAGSGDPQNLFGAIDISGMSMTFLPVKDITFNLSADATLMPKGVRDVTLGAYTDMRASEFTRFYAAASWTHNISSQSSLVDTTEGFSLDEIFVDTAINRKFFFRLGKQRISWGVGNWYKPADVLSLAAIDPDNPTANREGPFAFKADMPFHLNHATLYVVPPVDGDISAVSVAGRTDIVTGGFELSLAGFFRADMKARPRLMFMFSGAIGDFDVYGENVVAWGSDRTYVRPAGIGYETYTVRDVPVFQSTAGIKYSRQNSNGLSVSFNVQGFYNGMGYADSSILQIAAARKAIKDSATYVPGDLRQAGLFYLAASASVGTRSGKGKDLVNTNLSAYALANFSDMSVRVNPSFSITLGSGGSGLDLSVSAPISIGKALSEYAPKGNAVTPRISATIMNAIVVSASAPLSLNDDFSLRKAGVDFSLYWDIVSFRK